jgi:predicted HD superfamily hydrolase involved in NAD metabolism
MINFNVERESVIAEVKQRLSERRFEHTLGVCEMAELLSSYCLPEDGEEIFFAALLHDIAKELTEYELRDVIVKEGIVLDVSATTPILHSYAAPHIVKRDFPQLATPKILSAVAKHTVGDECMTVFDEIIFLADYIERGRAYRDCIATREFILSKLVKGDVSASVNALHKACIMSMELTCNKLLEKGQTLNPKTLYAKKALMAKIY